MLSLFMIQRKFSKFNNLNLIVFNVLTSCPKVYWSKKSERKTKPEVKSSEK